MLDPARTSHTRADLAAMLADGMAFSFMVGIGESYLAPFALALGMGDVAAGLIATAPMVVGAVLQLVTPMAVGLLGSHKRWVVLCAGLQAASFVPLVLGALDLDMSRAVLFLTVSIYWGLGMSTGPAWNTWAEAIVPGRLRARYFARRAGWSQLMLLAGLAAGGAVLEIGRRQGHPLEPYALVFGAALLARLISAIALSRQSEPRPVRIGETRISPAAIREHVRAGGHGRLLVFLLIFNSSVWIAAPYFTPYMLGPLGLDYPAFTVLTGSAFLSRILAMPLLGRVIHRTGTRRVMWLSSIGIVPLPALWLVSDSLAWLFALQLVSGFAWAAFELSTLLSFFEHIPERGRTSVLTVYNLVYAFAIVIGSVVGAGVLEVGGRDASAYAWVLGLSCLARLGCLGLLHNQVNVVPASDQSPPLRTLALRLSAGALERPVMSGLDDDTRDEDGDPTVLGPGGHAR